MTAANARRTARFYEAKRKGKDRTIGHVTFEQDNGSVRIPYRQHDIGASAENEKKDGKAYE